MKSIPDDAMDTALVTSSAQLIIARPPQDVLDEAHRAARALKDVLDAKPNKVMFNGEQYLEFEDWQTLGRFYGVTAKVVSTAFVEYADVNGFSARAVALRADGAEISAAEAECLHDEPNWKSKPLFQLKSMAQTRACAKVFRNVLAWVVVLAGYRPTPAEELPTETVPNPVKNPTRMPQDARTASGSMSSMGEKTDSSRISEKQIKRLFAIAKSHGWTTEAIRSHLLEHYGLHHTNQIRIVDYDQIVADVERVPSVAPPDDPDSIF
jgi:hypothetical protein